MAHKKLDKEAELSKTPAEPKKLSSDELHETDLDKVTGGCRKAGKDQQEFIKITIKDVLITG